VEWIELAQDRFLEWAFVKTAMKFRFLSNSDIHGQLMNYKLLREGHEFTLVRILYLIIKNDKTFG
jgi:hypothetical protein